MLMSELNLDRSIMGRLFCAVCIYKKRTEIPQDKWLFFKKKHLFFGQQVYNSHKKTASNEAVFLLPIE